MKVEITISLKNGEEVLKTITLSEDIKRSYAIRNQLESMFKQTRDRFLGLAGINTILNKE